MSLKLFAHSSAYSFAYSLGHITQEVIDDNSVKEWTVTKVEQNQSW